VGRCDNPLFLSVGKGEGYVESVARRDKLVSVQCGSKWLRRECEVCNGSMEHLLAASFLVRSGARLMGELANVEGKQWSWLVFGRK